MKGQEQCVNPRALTRKKRTEVRDEGGIVLSGRQNWAEVDLK